MITSGTLEELLKQADGKPIRVRCPEMTESGYYQIVARTPKGEFVGFTSDGDSLILSAKHIFGKHWTLFIPKKKMLAWRFKEYLESDCGSLGKLNLQGMIVIMPEDIEYGEYYERAPSLDYEV